VRVEHRTLVDEGQDLSRVSDTIGEVKVTTGDDRRRREDVHRVLIPAGAAVIYKVDEPIQSWRAIFFRDATAADIRVSYSSDGTQFEAAKAKAAIGPKGAGDYDYLQQMDLGSAQPPRGVQYLRLQAEGGALELSRLELRYGRKLLTSGDLGGDGE
jgi:hypothetical protein